MKNKITRTTVVNLLLIPVLSLGLLACQDQNTRFEETVEDAADATGDAADSAEETLEDAGETTMEMAEDAAESSADALEDAADELESSY